VGLHYFPDTSKLHIRCWSIPVPASEGYIEMIALFKFFPSVIHSTHIRYYVLSLCTLRSFHCLHTQVMSSVLKPSQLFHCSVNKHSLLGFERLRHETQSLRLYLSVRLLALRITAYNPRYGTRFPEEPKIGYVILKSYTFSV